MSSFEVTTTQGQGYVSGNAATAFKTDQQLMDIPQADVVVTNDLITDLNYENTTDIIQYFGASTQVQGEYFNLRGNATLNTPYLDEMPTLPAYADDSIIDSIEIIKGPAQTLYLNAQLEGVVLKATKKPLPYSQDVVTASVDTNGLFRTMIDSTGPIGKFGDFTLSYRFVAVYQHGNTYFDNTPDNRIVAFPEFEVQYHDTTVRTYYNVSTIKGETAGIDILTPSGGLYTGDGVHFANQVPENANQVYETKTVYAEILQKISSNWELRVQGGYWDFDTSGVLGLAIDENWDNDTEDFIARRNNEVWHYWSAFFDLNGHYNIGTIENRDALGYAFSDQTDKQVYWSAATSGPYAFGTDASGGVINVPFNSAAAITSLPVPPNINDYPPSPNEGQQYKTELTALYWQHSIDIIPNWLQLLAGFTWDTAQETSVANISALPWNATYVPTGDWVHRIAALVHITPAISIYAMNSTTFTPPPSNASILSNFQLAPPQIGKGNEVGLKWLFLGGKISGEVAYFRETLTNSLNINAGEFPNGDTYSILVGSVTEPGVDGDMALSLVPGWELIGSFSYTHQRDPFGNPLSDTYDNSMALLTRYDFSHVTPLKLTVGGGLTRIGSRWLSSYGFVGNSAANLPAFIKLKTGSLVNGLVQYRVNKHISLQMNVINILDEHYPLDAEITSIVDPEPGREFTFEGKYKF